MYKNKKVGFVVNYFWRDEFPVVIRSSALLAIQMLKNCDSIDDILLVDGSIIPDELIKTACNDNQIKYLHTGKELGFAEGFNYGWRLLSVDYVGLMASDVFPSSESIDALLNSLSNDEVGCVVPYLDYCDYPGQVFSFVRKPYTCEPSSISLNLLIIKQSLLKLIGGIEENYSGGYNDLIILMKVRLAGSRVLLVGNTRVPHIGRMTVAYGTNFVKQNDDKQFSIDFPQYRANHGKWLIRHWQWPFATTWRASFFWWLAQNFPSRKLRNCLELLTIMMEPELTKSPARYGQKRMGQK